MPLRCLNEPVLEQPHVNYLVASTLSAAVGVGGGVIGFERNSGCRETIHQEAETAPPHTHDSAPPQHMTLYPVFDACPRA